MPAVVRVNNGTPKGSPPSPGRPTVWPGSHAPLGANWDGEGTNFSIFAEHAEGVAVVLFDRHGRIADTLPLQERTDFHWHGYVYGVGPGTHYGYRIKGPYDPARGLRYNENKFLVDPYAKAIAGEVQWGPEVFGYAWPEPGEMADDTVASPLDSSECMPRSVVVDPHFPWGDDRRPNTAWSDTVIYETHVRGFTMQHPDIPPELRGTYAGLAHPAAIEHLTRLGVTAVELMPVHHFIDPKHLTDQGLRNYWGYDSIGYLAPEARYSSAGARGAQAREFKAMVRSLHRAGLEVILDVVYNHTAEGNHMGPTLAFRGIDNQAYYRLSEEDPRFYFDVTGTGNTLNVRQPSTLRLIMDSLRYWVLDMHVDGFRFDLASALAREFYDVDRLSAFFDIIHQDPVLSQVKLIAEPWDVGEGGYQVGNFPVRWAEWNGRYRDTVRDYWRGQAAGVSDLAYRLTGSSDLYESDGRRPWASVNFVTAHDGFTLRDLVSYNDKHNDANGEENRDGTNDNRSWNHGVEGETDDPGVIELRSRQRRNMLATVLLSQGCPMLLGGDEIGQTQGGNNNAYCQDNEISWYDWEHLDGDLLEFSRRLIALRRAHPVLRRRRWFQGRPIRGAVDLGWCRPDGAEMSDEDWDAGFARSVGLFLNGDAIAGADRRGQRVTDDSFLLLFNAHDEAIDWTLPSQWGDRWEPVLETSGPEWEGEPIEGGGVLPVAGRSVVLLRRVVTPAAES